MPLNIADLQAELTSEFFAELTRAKKMGWGSWGLFWYGARSSALSTVIANLPGVKLMISADDPKYLLDMIERASLFADHIVIRHQSLTPSDSFNILADVPPDFTGYDMPRCITKEGGNLNKLLNLPHSRSPPHEIDMFLDWCLKQGRPWIESGLVTYAPFLPPEKVELVSSQLQGININHSFIKANLMPNISSQINESVAKAIWSIPHLYPKGINPKTLIKVKEDNKDSLTNFNKVMVDALRKVDKCQNSSEFNKEVKTIYEDIVKVGIEDVNKSFSSLKRGYFSKASKIVVNYGLATISFYLGAPPFINATAFGAATLAAAGEISQVHKERASIKEKPMYILSKLRTVTRK